MTESNSWRLRLQPRSKTPNQGLDLDDGTSITDAATEVPSTPRKLTKIMKLPAMFSQSEHDDQIEPFHAELWSWDSPPSRKYEPDIGVMQQTVMSRILTQPHTALPIPYNSLILHVLESYGKQSKALEDTYEKVSEYAREKRDWLIEKQRLTDEVAALRITSEILRDHIVERQSTKETKILDGVLRRAVSADKNCRSDPRVLETSTKQDDKPSLGRNIYNTANTGIRSTKSSEHLSDRGRDSYMSVVTKRAADPMPKSELGGTETDKEFRALRFLAESMAKRRGFTLRQASSQLTNVFLGVGRNTKSGLKIKKKEMAKLDTVSANLVQRLNNALDESEVTPQDTSRLCMPQLPFRDGSSQDIEAEHRTWSFSTGDDQGLPRARSEDVSRNEGHSHKTSHAVLQSTPQDISAAQPQLPGARRMSDVRSTHSKIPSPKYSTPSLARRRAIRSSSSLGTVIHCETSLPGARTAVLPGPAMTVHSVRGTLPTTTTNSESSKSAASRMGDRCSSDAQSTSRKSSAAVMAARVASRLSSGSSLDLTKIMSTGPGDRPRSAGKRVRQTLIRDCFAATAAQLVDVLFWVFSVPHHRFRSQKLEEERNSSFSSCKYLLLERIIMSEDSLL